MNDRQSVMICKEILTAEIAKNAEKKLSGLSVLSGYNSFWFRLIRVGPYLKVFLKKIKLMADAFFEVVPSIDIKVPDGIVFDLSIFHQFFFGFGAYWS